MVSILLGLAAIVVVIGIAFLMSNDKKNINFVGVGVMLLAQLVTTFFMFQTP